uniref:YciI family protein n=1 Tax=Herbidospora sakaeratensis TaxID=564415 RepID=UPI0034E1BF9D
MGSPEAATVIDNRGGEAIVTDGPFVETKEYLAGFWIIEAPRPGRGAHARRRGVEGLQPCGRSCEGPAAHVRAAIIRAHHEE